MIGQLALNTTCLAALGEPVTFVFAGGNVELTGIFGTDRKKAEVGNAAFNDAQHTLELLSADVSEHNIALRGAVIVRGVNYQILEIADDTGGMTKLFLRRY